MLRGAGSTRDGVLALREKMMDSMIVARDFMLPDEFVDSEGANLAGADPEEVEKRYFDYVNAVAGVLNHLIRFWWGFDGAPDHVKYATVDGAYTTMFDLWQLFMPDAEQLYLGLEGDIRDHNDRFNRQLEHE